MAIAKGTARRWVLLCFCMALTAGIRGAELGSFDSDGTKIRYYAAGRGEPVILVHGFMASAALNWSIPGVTKHLAEKYRVIALDVRGHGMSDKPDVPEAYGLHMVEDVVSLMDHLKIEKARVVGYSMGGMIVMKMAALHPERMKSAVVGGMGWIDAGKRRPAFLAELGSRLRNPAFKACSASWPALTISEDELKSIKVPMTVVIGDDDGFLKSTVEPLMAVRPDIPVVKIPGANHRSCIFKPEFKTAIRDFLDETE
ncbi:MAG TPA: alpha/beta hydrolase [Candidatus Brocadiia bacterium]|nr:alpha/beta hydrolase [Candidatus Brocadiia bacterium]